jgi:hypothetical protein
MSRQTIVVVILALLLVVALGYIGVTQWRDAKAVEQNSIYQQGALVGYQQAVVDLVNAAVTCQTVPVRVNENTTIDMIAVACLQRAQQ